MLRRDDRPVVVKEEPTIRQPAHILSTSSGSAPESTSAPVAVIASAVCTNHSMDEETRRGIIRAMCDATVPGELPVVSTSATRATRSAALEAVCLGGSAGGPLRTSDHIGSSVLRDNAELTPLHGNNVPCGQLDVADNQIHR